MKTHFIKSIIQLLTIAIISTFIFSSCKFLKKADYESLVNENTLMKDDIYRSDSIHNCFMGAYAEIERNLDEIKAREKMISAKANTAENHVDQQQKILNDISEIGKLMDANRKKLRQMQSMRKQLIESKKQTARVQEENRQLREGILPTTPQPAPTPTTGDQSDKLSYYGKENQRLAALNSTMSETINQLKNKVAESEARIESLQEELALLKDAYAALQAINDSLQIEIVRYQRESGEKDAEINTLNDQVYVAYYCIGNAKELKTKGVLEKKIVSANISDGNFVRIPNYTEKRVIETNSSKAALISSHPTSSYTINSKDAKNLKIEIKNPAKFWGATRYCVIQVK